MICMISNIIGMVRIPLLMMMVMIMLIMTMVMMMNLIMIIIGNRRCRSYCRLKTMRPSVKITPQDRLEQQQFMIGKLPAADTTQNIKKHRTNRINTKS